MPINSTHPQYAARFTEMEDCRNCYEGGRAIKKAGIRYLPKLKSQTDPDYQAYKMRATFFGITAKTVAAMVGMAMMRNPIVKHSDRMGKYFKEFQGAQFLEICSTTIAEVLLMGGYGYFIDASVGGGDPQLIRYTRESIINWRVDSETDQVLMVMLLETICRAKPSDQYDYEEIVQYRELAIGVDGFYGVTLYDDKFQQVGGVTYPTVKGVKLKKIPFYLVNPLGVSMDLIKSPVLDIVDLNLSHYRTSADLEHGRHFTGLPTPIVTGVEAATKLYIGSTEAWCIPDPNAKAYFMEFEGQGLQSLEKAMQEKQGQMASMSARLIDNSKRGSEAAETVKLRYMSESASLITVVRSVEGALNLVYAEMGFYLDEPAPEIRLNKEFLDIKMSPQELNALVQAYIEGTISKETLVYNFRKGDVIGPEQDDEKEKDAIKDPPPQPTPKPQPAEQGA